MESKRCCEEDRKRESEIFGPALNWYAMSNWKQFVKSQNLQGDNDLAVYKTIKQDKPIQRCKCVFSSIAIAMVRKIAGLKTTLAESAAVEGRKYAGAVPLSAGLPLPPSCAMQSAGTSME